MDRALVERNMHAYSLALTESRWSPPIIKQFFLKLLGYERPLVKIRNLPYAEEGINIHDKEIINIEGEKSKELLAHLSGIKQAPKGSILVREGNYFDELDRASWAYQVGYAGENHSLYPELTIAQNWRYFAKQYGMNHIEITGRVERLKDTLGLGPYMHLLVHELPSEIAAFADLGCALMHEPKLLVVSRPKLSERLFNHYGRILHEERIRGTTIIGHNIRELGDRHITLSSAQEPRTSKEHL